MPRIVVGALESAGADAGALLATLGVERALLDEVDARLPVSVDLALWAEAPRLTGDDCFGLHAAERVRPGAFDVLGYSLRTSADVGSAFSRLVRYDRFLHEQSEMGLAVHGAEARLTFQLFPEGTPRQQAEFSLAVFLLFAREATGRDVTPVAVEFGHPEPADVSEHRRIFRAPLRFSRPRPALVFPRAVLGLPLRQADPVLLAILEKQVARLVARFPPAEDPVERLRRLVAGRIAVGEPTVESMARELGLSPRTLHRRLREGGTSFREIVDGLRREMAVAYLADPRVAIAEAAYLLGFSEASAFHRSFKRWTGRTPAEYRRAAAASGPVA